MTVLFSIHASRSPKGFGKPCVHAVPAMLAGVYDEASGEIITPDKDAVRETLPHYWRKAFDRAGTFWFNKNAKLTTAGRCADTPYMTLHDARGRYLNTLYAIPYRFDAGRS